MMRKRGYGTYRGRRTWHDILKLLIAVLLVLALALAGIFLLGRDRMLQPEEEEQTPTQQTPQEPQTEPEPAPEPEPEPEPEPFVMAAVGVDVAQILDGTWSQSLESAGANSVIVDMKPDDAALNWVSAQAMAVNAKANSTIENVNEQIKTWNDGDVYAVARMSCFRDDLLAGTKAYCIRSNSDYRWKDFGGVYWTSATVPEVQDYLVALAVELAELGFDEILLDNCGYPQDGSGEMGWIKKGAAYDLENLDTVVGQFLAKLHEALEPYDTVISIRTNPTVIQNDGAKTGLTGAVLEQYADRIWMSGEGAIISVEDTLAQAGISNAPERAVMEVAALQEGSTQAMAVMSDE